MQAVIFVILAVITGSIISLQNVINASLGRYVGELGAVFIVATIGVLIILAAIIIRPGSADFHALPGADRWYLYLGGVFGIIIVTLPVFLVPRIGATSTITGIVIGQLVMALAADQFGLFGTPRIEVSVSGVIGVILLGAGAFLVVRVPR
ncbi:MAG TPA: DMT family transporter [Spirochaetia bacterium]|nr:DMT family transporter [Spirochaetia bacterium]